MAFPQIVTQHTDAVQHRKRISETVNGILRFQHDDSRIATLAETNNSLPVINAAYEPGDVRRWGVTPNDSTLATQNTARLKAALDPTEAGYTGRIRFHNTTGSDTYYFNGVIPIRDGIHMDLMGCTLDCTYTATAADTNSGFLFALRDFSCENGAIKMAVDTSAATSCGGAIQIGARASDSSYFTVYDSLLSVPMGHIRLKNLRITINNTGTNIASSAAIGMLGGIQNASFENVYIDGSGTLQQGFAYEFGWATSGAQPRQTSHANGLRFTNVHITNGDAVTATATGFVLAGAYSTRIDGLYVTGYSIGISITSGESLFYLPWSGMDATGAKRNILMRNIVVGGFTSEGIILTGSQAASGGYLSTTIAALSHPQDYLAQTDLLDISIDGFSLNGGSGAFGILCSAGRGHLKNGHIIGCQRGIVRTEECTKLVVDGVDILGAQQQGIQLNGGSAIWSPARTGKIEIRNCLIAGNSASSAGTYAGIEIGANIDSCLIENNRIGYDSTHDGVSETTQGDGLFIASAAASNVICRANHIKITAAVGAVAYHNVNNTPPSNGNLIDNPTGDVTYSGLWDGVAIAATVTLTCATPGNLAITYTSQTLQYVKRGNKIDWILRIETSAFTWTSASGGVSITGLPYTINSTQGVPIGALLFAGITKAGFSQFAIAGSPGTATFIIQASNSGSALTSVAIADMPTGGAVVLRASGTYFV